MVLECETHFFSFFFTYFSWAKTVFALNVALFSTSLSTSFVMSAGTWRCYISSKTLLLERKNFGIRKSLICAGLNEISIVFNSTC